MSLTSFLNTPEIRKKFTSTFPRPKIKLEGDILSAPQTTHYRTIGTAFDYLVRFYMKYQNPDAVSKEWVAHSGLEWIKMHSGKYSIDLTKGRTLTRMLDNDDVDKNHPYYKGVDVAEEIFDRAKQNYEAYMKSGVITKELIKSTIELTSLDGVARSFNWYPPIVDDKDVEDLEKLIKIFRDKKIPINSPVYLNPTFGDGSSLVGGADADLIIGDTLIDIKTVKDLKFTQSIYSQSVGYYLLSKIGKINNSKKIKINNIGIYFSRYGILHIIPTSVLESQTNVDEFLEWFKKTAAKEFRKPKISFDLL